MGSFSIQVPFMPHRAEQAIPFAAFANRIGARRLWTGQAKYAEQHQVFTYAAGLGIRVAAGTGVSVMGFRHPYEAAVQARSVAIITGRPMVAGYGPGALDLQRRLHGHPYRSQLTAVREYVTLVRALLTGAPVEQHGEYFSFVGELTHVPHPGVEVALGVLRPAMARVAGANADAAVSWLAPAAYLRSEVLPALRSGAEAAGRPMPRMVAIVPVALRRAGRDPAELADTVHLRIPHYVDMLGRAGIDVATADAAARGQAAVDGRAFITGSAADIADQLAEFVDAGVDEIVLSVTGICLRYGPQAALAEFEALFGEVLPLLGSTVETSRSLAMAGRE
jgi:alkanesulfonate monooxygenase SsuD/methylene tetrahydromethanopterin reductase-like flavin-dependent oxidoreductase (luciferase family)